MSLSPGCFQWALIERAGMDTVREQYVVDREGKRTAVEKMLQWFHRGSPHARVEKVQTTEETPVGDAATFEIHYY